jgi:hypothetical protein
MKKTICWTYFAEEIGFPYAYVKVHTVNQRVLNK